MSVVGDRGPHPPSGAEAAPSGPNRAEAHRTKEETMVLGSLGATLLTLLAGLGILL